MCYPIVSSAQAMAAGENALTADKAALARARALADSGAAPEQIVRDTGWWRGPDGAWRFEIDDSPARLKMGPAVGSTYTMGNFLDHPEFFKAYPDAAKVPVRITGGGGKTAFHADKDKIDLGQVRGKDAMMKSLAHEAQHYVQKQEGFSQGGNMISEMFKLLDAGDRRQGKALDEAAFEAYEALPGEIEARTVENRLRMPAGQRRAIPFWNSR